MIRTATKAALCLAAGGLMSVPAFATGLRVTPLRLDLSGAQNSAQMELTNFGSGAVPVQVSVASWSQTDGRDAYVPSKDIFFAPPIVSVPAGGKAIVRFRLRGTTPTDTERAYRVYFQEVAPPQPKDRGGMSFRLRLGVPLFIVPARRVAPRLDVTDSPGDGVLALDLSNPGTAHLKIHGVELYPRDVDRERPSGAIAMATHSELGANYLLPGTRHRWSLKLPPSAKTGSHVLLIRTDDYSGKAAAGMTPAGWLWRPVPAKSAR